MANNVLRHKPIPLNGKLITSDDATQIGTNFQTLQNLRYTESHVKGVGGMTKINTNAITTYIKPRNGFHFAKYQPAESHVILHAFNTGLTSAALVQNTTAVPSAGDFSASALYSLTGTDPGNFSCAPNGNMAFANGDETLIWGGDEMPVSAFITSSEQVTYTATNSNDYSDILSNTLQTADQVATLSTSGGNDSYTKLLLHCDGTDGSTTFTDSSAGGNAVTAIDNAQIDTSQAKFGTASGYFDGSSDGLTLLDSADWYFGDGDFTIDFWVKFNGLTNAQTFIGQYDNATNYWEILKDTNANGNKLMFIAVYGGVTKASYVMSSSFSPGASWYHIAVVRNGSSLKIYINGVSQTLTETVAISTNDLGDIADLLSVGFLNGVGQSVYGWLDEVRISKGIARWTTNFTVPTQAYGNASNNFLVGVTRPIQGVKFYVHSGNTVASTMTVLEWQGTDWGTLVITDNTDTGATLAQTGTITWTYTGAAKPRYINGLSLYWYQFRMDAGSASIYYVTTDAPMQTIRNIWDGIVVNAVKCLKYDGTTYKDYTIEVADDSQATYADLSSLDTTHALYVGFLEPQQGLEITFVAGSENGTATVLTTSHWDGANWTVVTAQNDGTVSGTTSMSKGGVISWQGADKGSEFQRTISDEYPLYYYKLIWSVQLDADVKVSEIRGIPYPDNVAPHKNVAMFQNRLFLLAEKSGKKNRLLYSAYDSPDVFNGDDSGELTIGDDSDVTATATLNLVLTSALEQFIITKANETYRMFGDGPENWEIQKISSTVGCPAPRTMCTANIPLETGGNAIGKNIAIWQGADGIYITDGKTPSPVHQDIKDLFDKRNSNSINTSKIADSVGFVDHENLEYHWLFASGSSTTLDKEFVFDLRRWKWFEIVRGTGKQLQCGFGVTDTNGNTYKYGTIDTGYMLRLEYGNSFDTGNIVHTMQLGDIAPADDPLYETRVQYVNLAMAAKTTTSNSATYTHYVDTETTSTNTATFSPSASGKRISNKVANINSKPGVFHSPKVAMTTSNETIGFEPLYLGFFYTVEREHTYTG